MTKQLDQRDVIITLRRLLAAMIAKHGVFNKALITRKDIEAVANGELKVFDRPDGSIELAVRGPKPHLVAVPDIEPSTKVH